VGGGRAAVAAGARAPHDRVVVLVTGTGLKTPDVAPAREPAEIAPDVDLLLDELGVAA
jgi:threonine synthase